MAWLMTAMRSVRWSKMDGGKIRMRGSHRQFRHPDKTGTVTVAGSLGDDLARGTWNSIKRQAGLKE